MNKSKSLTKSLFLGQVEHQNLLPYPEMNSEEAETLRIVLESIDKFMGPKSEDFFKYDKKGEQPEKYINDLKGLGLFGLIIDEEFGGLGFSNSAYARVIQQTSGYDASTSLTIGAHSSIGMKGLLLYGDKKQKKKYLPKLASGDSIAAFCLTESGAGSDAASISTKAEKQKDGSWKLNGEKIWITNGAFADFFTVFAQTDPKHSADKKGKMTAFIVERGFGGVESGPKEDKMGIRASATTTISFNDVKIPKTCVLGEVGEGFKVAMAILNNGRTGLGGGAVGAMKRCINLSTRQAIDRKQFGQSISDYGLIQEKITQMTVNCFATESIVGLVGHYIDSDSEDYSIEAAISKIFASEALWETANMALQIAGGNGFMKEFQYEKIVRDSRINLIFEGTNEILRLYVALSCLKDVGQNLKESVGAISNLLSDPGNGLKTLGNLGSRKFSQVTYLGRPKVEGLNSALSKEEKVLTTHCLDLARASESLVAKHKKGIIERQFELKRLANIAIDLVIGFSVLSRVSSMIEEKGANECQSEIDIASIFTEQASVRIDIELDALKYNQDEKVSGLAKKIIDDEGYRWDTV